MTGKLIIVAVIVIIISILGYFAYTYMYKINKPPEKKPDELELGTTIHTIKNESFETLKKTYPKMDKYGFIELKNLCWNHPDIITQTHLKEKLGI